MSQVDLSQNVSLQEMFKNPSVTLSVAAGEDKKQTLRYLSVLFLKLQEQLNFSKEKKMDGQQLVFLCDMIIEEYPHYQFYDISKFCREILKGKLGVIFSKMDIPSIFEMLKKYDLNRINELEQFHQKLKNETDKEIKTALTGIPDIAQKELEKLYQKLDKGPRTNQDEVNRNRKKKILIAQYNKALQIWLEDAENKGDSLTAHKSFVKKFGTQDEYLTKHL